MLVYKCDKCKKTIRDNELRSTVTAGVGYDGYEFCRECGAPIARMLQNYKLIKK